MAAEKTYNVEKPMRFKDDDGKNYWYDPSGYVDGHKDEDDLKCDNKISLTEEEAKPLLARGLISDPSAGKKAAPAASEGN